MSISVGLEPHGPSLPFGRARAARVPGVVPGPAATAATCQGIRSLYVHIPFCERKCTYCDFTSVGGARGQRPYMAALITELGMLARVFPYVTLDTIFLGGGTPSLLEPQLLAALMEAIATGFRLAPDAEITMEANPSSTSARRADGWLTAGVNRVSIGIQSLQPDILHFLDRVHDRDRALGAVAAVRAAGFRRVSTDLIYAVPGLDEARWAATLDTVLELGCDHLSCYELTVEEGTPLALAVRRGEIAEVDPELALRQHWTTVARARTAGLEQYEVSNFARPGAECRHNLAYWRNEYWLAAGVGAHGHLPAAAGASLGLPPGDPSTVAQRFWHTDSIPHYVATLEAGRLPLGHEHIDARAAAEERLLSGLRLARGLELSEADVLDEAAQLERAGFTHLDGRRVTLTERGQEVLNEVVTRLALRLP